MTKSKASNLFTNKVHEQTWQVERHSYENQLEKFKRGLVHTAKHIKNAVGTLDNNEIFNLSQVAMLQFVSSCWVSSDSTADSVVECFRRRSLANGNNLWLNKRQGMILRLLDNDFLGQLFDTHYFYGGNRFRPAEKALMLGNFYESTLRFKLNRACTDLVEDKTESKKTGVYYTPIHIVEQMVSESLGQFKSLDFEELREITLVDPSVGGAAFIVVALEQLTALIEKKAVLARVSTNRKFIVRHLLKNCVYGVDLSEKAVAVSKFAVSVFCELFVNDSIDVSDMQIVQGDSLQPFHNSDVKSNFKWQTAFPKVFRSGGFDLVIGNPPYVVLEKGSADRGQYNYQGDTGKLNLVTLFLQLGETIVRQGGTFSLIIPRNLLADKSISKTRQMMFNGCFNVESIDVFPKEPRAARVFRDAAIPALIFRAKKGYKCRRIRIAKYASGETLETEFRYSIPYASLKDLLQRFDGIPVVSEQNMRVLIHASKFKNSFGNVFGRFHQGEINVSVFKEKLISGDSGFQLLEGKNVNASRVVGNRRRVARSLPPTKLKYLESYRVVMQGINGIDDRKRLVSLVTSGSLCAHSTNFIAFDNKDDAHLLHALLNSSYAEMIFRSFSCNNNINSYEIERIPLVADRTQLEKYSSSLINISKRAHKSGDLDQSELDSIVEKMLKAGAA